MDAKLPAVIELCIREGAARLGRALRKLEWPNGGKDAPPNELNAIINISSCLGNQDPPFHLYAEGTIAKRGRVDLIGFDGNTAFAMEAKAFGKINNKSTEVLSDLQRLRIFSPSMSELAHNVKAEDWWKGATSRWAIVVISSFRGTEVKDAWLADDEAEACKLMANYRPADRAIEVDGMATGFLALHRELRETSRGAVLITNGQPWGGGEGWLLWAAVPVIVDR